MALALRRTGGCAANRALRSAGRQGRALKSPLLAVTELLLQATQAPFSSIGRRAAVLLAFAAFVLPAAAEQRPPLFVLNSLDATVSVIDPVSWTERQRIPTGKEPHHLYMTPDEKSVIVANSAGDSLTFLNPRTAEVQRVVYGIIDPYQLQFSRDMKWFVTAGNRLNHVDIYRWDGKDLKLASRVMTGKTPSHIWIDAASTVAYVTMQDSDELVAIDLATQKIRWRMPTGAMPADIFGVHNDRTLLVGLTGSDGVQVFDVAGEKPVAIGMIPTGKGAHAFRSGGDGRTVFVSNRVANTISRIDLRTLKVIESYPVPGGPDCMDLSADGKTLFVTSRWAKRLSVIDLATTKAVVRTVNVGRSPHGVWTLEHAPR